MQLQNLNLAWHFNARDTCAGSCTIFMWKFPETCAAFVSLRPGYPRTPDGNKISLFRDGKHLISAYRNLNSRAPISRFARQTLSLRFTEGMDTLQTPHQPLLRCNRLVLLCLLPSRLYPVKLCQALQNHLHHKCCDYSSPCKCCNKYHTTHGDA